MSFSRRAVALAALVAYVPLGGVPMCATLVIQATHGCAMHGHAGSPSHGLAHAKVGAVGHADHDCHDVPDGTACGAAGACPAAGVAVGDRAPSGPGSLAAGRPAHALPVSKLHSYQAPPPSPPPQG